MRLPYRLFRKRSGIHFVEDHRTKKQKSLRMRDKAAAIPGGPRCTVIPDGVFGLEFADGQLSWFVLEADRATMPVMRRNLDHSSFRRKMLAYQATWAQNLHRTQLGWQRFCVLTVTTSPDRLDTMRATCRTFRLVRKGPFFSTV